MKQHCCHEYWCHEHGGDDYGGGGVPWRALAACVGEQRAVLDVQGEDVQREDAKLPVPVVLHEHDEDRSRPALDLTCCEPRLRSADHGRTHVHARTRTSTYACSNGKEDGREGAATNFVVTR